jgi:hypothetical protein
MSDFRIVKRKKHFEWSLLNHLIKKEIYIIQIKRKSFIPSEHEYWDRFTLADRSDYKKYIVKSKELNKLLEYNSLEQATIGLKALVETSKAIQLKHELEIEERNKSYYELSS